MASISRNSGRDRRSWRLCSWALRYVSKPIVSFTGWGLGESIGPPAGRGMYPSGSVAVDRRSSSWQARIDTPFTRHDEHPPGRGLPDDVIAGIDVRIPPPALHEAVGPPETLPTEAGLLQPARRGGIGWLAHRPDAAGPEVPEGEVDERPRRLGGDALTPVAPRDGVADVRLTGDGIGDVEPTSTDEPGF